MRFFLLSVFILFCTLLEAQVLGDLTKDDIIDANDFLLLKESVLSGKPLSPIADFDGDDRQTVRDLLMLHNFLYKNGAALGTINLKKPDERARIQFGQLNPKKKTLEIKIAGNGLKAFEFEIPNIEELKLSDPIPNVHVVRNKVIGFNLDHQLIQEELVLTINLPEGISAEYCIDKTLFIDNTLSQLTAEIGDCANPSWSVAGLEQVLNEVQQNTFSVSADIDLNGKVDIKDYMVLYDYLYRKGETPPGKFAENTKRVKIDVINNDVQDDMLEVVLTSESKINAFDFSIYGIDTIYAVYLVSSKNREVMLEGNRIIYLEKEKSGEAKVVLHIKHNAFQKNGKVCIQSPVVLDGKHQYGQVKLGRCLDVYPIIYGCTDKKAINFNSKAILDDGSCQYPKVEPKKEVLVHEKKELPKKKEKENKVAKQPREKKVKEELAKVDKTKKTKKKKEDVAANQDKQNEIVKKDPTKKTEKVTKEKKSTEKEVQQISITQLESTVKILSVTQEQLSLLKDMKKGQLIYHVDQSTFMIFDGRKWKKIAAIPEHSIK